MGRGWVPTRRWRQLRAAMIANALYLGEPCPICRQPMRAEQKLSLDHIIPVSLGGDDRPSNVRVTHLGCNIRRGNKLPAMKDMPLTNTSRQW
jgi:5-methylcytosine-specific restriction endonuclease McrA